MPPPLEAICVMYVGIDVGADECSAAMVDEQGETLRQLEFQNESDGWAELIRSIDKDSKIAMEACTMSYPLHDFLTAEGFSISVAHPSAVVSITKSKSKTDEKDSIILANLLRLNYLPTAYIPPPEVLAVRDVLRARIRLSQEIASVKNRVHAFLAKNGYRPMFKRKSDIFGKAGRRMLNDLRIGDHRDSVLRTLLNRYDSLTEQKGFLDTEIATISRDNDQVKTLMTIPGIDFYSALIIVNEIGDINRFKSAEALCMYAGLVPSVRSSANVTRTGRITKNGPPALRWILTLATEHIIRFDNPIRHFYRRISRRKRSKKVARVAAARKLLVMIYFMLKRNEACRWEIEGLTNDKLERLRRTGQRKVLNA